MSFFAANNRIYVTDSNGQVMFDTNNKMPAITRTISGRVNMDKIWDSRLGWLPSPNRIIGYLDSGENFLYPFVRSADETSTSIGQEMSSLHVIPLLGTYVGYQGWGPYGVEFSGLSCSLSGNAIVLSRQANQIYMTVDYHVVIGKTF